MAYCDNLYKTGLKVVPEMVDIFLLAQLPATLLHVVNHFLLVTGQIQKIYQKYFLYSYEEFYNGKT